MYPYYNHNEKAYGSPASVPRHYYPNGNFPYFYRQLPEINPNIFMTSAQQMQRLMKDASILLDKMASSRKFSLALMEAAQASNQAKVNQVIKETGIVTIPKITYTPDGLKLYFKANAENVDCCHLTLNLRWM